MTTNNYYIAIVPALHIQDLWFKLLPHLMKGEKYWNQFFDIEDIRHELILGRQQLWIMVEKDQKKILCVVLTQLDQFPKCRVLRILYLGGEDLYPGMMKEMARLEQWALDHGATMIDFLGRKEWEKLVGKLGYKATGVVLRKELKEL